MEYSQTIELLSRLWGLLQTVRESAAYLAAHPDDAAMRRDVAAGLQALRTHLQAAALPPEGKQHAAQAEAIFGALAAQLSDGTDAEDGTRQLENAAAPLAQALCSGFLEATRQGTYLTRAQAEPIFAFCDTAPHTFLDMYQLAFVVYEKAAISMPQESYEATLRLMEEQPGLLSAESHPHPGYLYRPAPQRTFHCCPICGGEGHPYFRAFSYYMNTFTPPHLPTKLWMRCADCGNLYTYQYPEALLTQASHPELVQPNAAKALTAVREINVEILSIWSTILNRLHTYTPGKDLLEVGIGEGCLLSVALEMGYRPDAVEIVRESAQNVADLLQIPIWNGDFLDYHSEKQYDVIIMGDVIEHVTAPEQALRSAHRLLADDGVLWLSTPNFESGFSRMMKFRDVMWNEPFHISYFSFAGLQALAEQCGFTVREYQASRRYKGSMELVLTKAAR